MCELVEVIIILLVGSGPPRGQQEIQDGLGRIKEDELQRPQHYRKNETGDECVDSKTKRGHG